MKYERMLQVFSEVDEALVEDAAPARQTARRTIRKHWGAIAACLLLTAGIGFGLWHQTGGNPGYVPNESEEEPTTTTTTVSTTARTENVVEEDKDEHGTTPDSTTHSTTKKAAIENATTPTTRFPTSIMGTTITRQQFYMVPHWDEMTITQQFSETTYQGNRYSIHNASVPKDKIGAQLGTDTVSGFDIYTDTTHTTNVTLFAIDSIAEECAIAVQYEGVEGFFPAVHSWYKPETLGQFITDLDLKKQVSFGTVYYKYFDENKQYRRFRFADIDDRVVWEMLLSDATLANVHDDREMYSSLMGISVDIPILGYENISLAITEEGYLTTNILNSGKAFFIGKDKVNAFIDYVLTHCEGVELVYETDLTSAAYPTGTEGTVTATSSARPPKTTSKSNK